jgi:hypothetical protein
MQIVKGILFILLGTILSLVLLVTLLRDNLTTLFDISTAFSVGETIGKLLVYSVVAYGAYRCFKKGLLYFK